MAAMFGAGGQDDEKPVIPGTYEIYKAEADLLFKRGDFKKAIESYTTALKFRDGDRITLVCRSRCYLMLGENVKALQDAEASLTEKPSYHKGMFQKAEALYNQGDFEMALVFYHRGNRLRPELQDFRLGIQKAQEAIYNCVGTPDRIKLNTTGDLSFFVAQDVKKKQRKGASCTLKPQVVPKRKKPTERQAGNEITIRQMLGELYGDRLYLEKILRETDNNTSTGKKINALAEEGLKYLDTRTELWQQVKPMYARKYEARLALNRGRALKTSPHDYIIKELERIEGMMVEENYEGALKRSRRVAAILEGYTESQLSNKMTFKSNLHSIQGNACLELEDYASAAKHHQIDLAIGEDYALDEAECRALDNLGRVHARNGNFHKAIEVWERKLPLSKGALETTWLCHELGRCYLELGMSRTAKEYGERSLAAAQEAEDDRWQLHALVLISQAEVKSGRLSSSLINFENAYEMAGLLADEEARSAIKRAIDDVNAKLLEREQDSGDELASLAAAAAAEDAEISEKSAREEAMAEEISQQNAEQGGPATGEVPVQEVVSTEKEA